MTSTSFGSEAVYFDVSVIDRKSRSLMHSQLTRGILRCDARVAGK